MFPIRLDEESKRKLYKLSKDNKTSKAEVIRKLISDSASVITKTDKEVLGEILLELKRQGNNINQIARISNSEAYVKSEHLYKINEYGASLEKMSETIFDICEKLE